MINEQLLKEALNLIEKKLYVEAIPLLTTITNSQPELDQAWLHLSKCYEEIEELSNQREAYKQYEMISWFNQQLSKAKEELRKSDFKNTQKIIQDLLKLVPNEKRCLLLLSEAAFKAGDLQTYFKVSQYNFNCNPTSITVTFNYLETLFNTKHFSEFIQVTSELDNVDLSPRMTSLLAACHVKQMNFELAFELFSVLEEQNFHPSICLLRMGNIKKIIGDSAQAIDLYKAALKKDNTNTETYWNLANLKTYKFTDNEIKDLEALSTSLLQPTKKAFIHFALGKAYEQKNDCKTAFNHYKAGNLIKNKHIKYRESKFDTRCVKSINKDLITKLPTIPSPPFQLVFIVGMPRSGSTLIEQILASHSKVDASYELTEIISIAKLLEQKNTSTTPYGLDNITEQALIDLSKRYLKFIEPLRNKKPIFIDKLPANYQHIALIKSLFPNAKIIDVRRDNKATAWSLYKHTFSEGHTYSYSFENLAQYINKHCELMEHWKALYSDDILSIQYEHIIKNFDSTVKEIMSFCSIEIEESCYSFYNSKRPVLTPSSEQVRQPIYKDALNDWKKFKPYLEPLIKLLN